MTEKHKAMVAYAKKHGAEATAKKYKCHPATVYNWLRKSREGIDMVRAGGKRRRSHRPVFTVTGTLPEIRKQLALIEKIKVS